MIDTFVHDKAEIIRAGLRLIHEHGKLVEPWSSLDDEITIAEWEK